MKLCGECNIGILAKEFFFVNIKQRGYLGAYLLSCGCRLGCCQHSHELGSEIRLQPYSTSLPTLKV